MIARRSFCGLLAALPLPASLLGCASPNPTLYTLAPVSGASVPGGPRVVTLRTVGLARYLERPQIVRSSENYQLNIAANDWWGEPLGAMVSRVLSAELAQRLPGSSVFSEAGAISVQADATAEVNIQRLDADAPGNVILDAQLAVSSADSRRRTATRIMHVSIPPPHPGMTGQVAASSAALGRIADTLADMLRNRSGRVS
jgi:uncharacterized lipoprotein YmbA